MFLFAGLLFTLFLRWTVSCMKAGPLPACFIAVSFVPGPSLAENRHLARIVEKKMNGRDRVLGGQCSRCRFPQGGGCSWSLCLCLIGLILLLSYYWLSFLPDFSFPSFNEFSSIAYLLLVLCLNLKHSYQNWFVFIGVLCKERGLTAFLSFLREILNPSIRESSDFERIHRGQGVI